MIANANEKSTVVIVGTYNRASYLGRLVKIEEGRVYLADAMRLPWTFDFEAMSDMAANGPPNQQAVAWPKRKGKIALFRPEEMIECESDAAVKWLDMRWLREDTFKPAGPIVSRADQNSVDPYCTLGT